MGRADVDLKEMAQAFAFLGNSFLKSMSQTSDVALDCGFWAAFPDFGDDGVAEALEQCFQWAAQGEGASRDERVRAVSVEYARLFVGPPEPAAAPWETFHEREGVESGFGEPTFRMRERLRSLGLAVTNENNQYDDHIGIELLCCSEYVRRGAGDETLLEEGRRFASDSLRPWARRFAARLKECSAEYYSLLAELSLALVDVFVSSSAAGEPSNVGKACSPMA